jgi:LysM repeat protein
MKKLVLLFALIVCFLESAKAQDVVSENFTSHKVEMGETVLLISKKYKITPRDIYDYNQDAVNGVSYNAMLRIPLHRQIVITGKSTDDNKGDAVLRVQPTSKKPAEKDKLDSFQPKTEAVVVEVAQKETASLTNDDTGVVEHEVAKGETLIGLAEQYNTTVAEITRQNAVKLKHGLQAGQTLFIAAKLVIKDELVIEHEVLSGETLIGLARTYRCTVADITNTNERLLKRGLQAGQKLKIKAGVDNIDTIMLPVATTAINNLVESDTAGNSISEKANVEHRVQSGETLTGLAKKYNTTIEKITENNKKHLRNGLQAGQVINIK